MLVANPNKRKSFGIPNGTPQSAKKGHHEVSPKKLKPGTTPQKTPNEQQKPKGAFSGKKQQQTPGNTKELLSPVGSTPTRLSMFGGLAKLQLSQNAGKNGPGSAKKDFGSAKKGLKTPNQAVAAAGAEDEANRHTRRRKARKHKRSEARDKLKQLTIQVKQGDAAARKEIEEKVKELEKRTNRSKTATKKLKNFQDLLAGKKTLRPEKPDQGAVQNQQKKGAAKNQVNKGVAQKQQTPANKQNQQGGKQNQVTQKAKQNQLNQQKGKKVAQEESEDELEEESDEDDASGEDEEVSDEDSSEELPNNLLGVTAEDFSDDEEESADEEGSEEDDSDDEGSEEESSEEQDSPNAKKTKPNQQPPTKKTQIAGKGPTPNLNDSAQKDGKVSRYVVFVGNLPYTATREELTEHFKKVGDIVDVRIPNDQATKKPKGFAYVEVKNEEGYQRALSLHHTFLGGRRINVLYTQGGKKKSEDQKGEIKAKNQKLQAMRNQGQLVGSVKADQKRSVRRAKKQQFEKQGQKA